MVKYLRFGNVIIGAMIFIFILLFTNYCYFTFDIGNISLIEYKRLVANLNIDYINSKYINEGYLVFQNGNSKITVVGFDFISLAKLGYPVVGISFQPPWEN